MLEFMFWFLIVLIFYTYFGYPVLVCLLARVRPQAFQKEDICPTASLIVVAYNEDDCIREKIENSITLDYPREKLEIIFASDGSTDLTDSIIAEYTKRGIKFLKFNHRRGKATCVNDTVQAAKGEILVLSDANVICEKDAIRKLVRNFVDNRVGGVAGEVHYRFDEASTNEGEGIFSRYDRFIERCESGFYSLINVDGAMYAIRRSLYGRIRQDAITDDFMMAMNMLSQGYRIIYEAEAKGIEKTRSSSKDEFRRKARMIAGGYQTLSEFKNKVDKFPLPVIFEFVSHKIFRWLIPFFLIAIFMSNIFLLNTAFYRILFVLQIIFYLCGIAGVIFERKNIKTPFSVLYYFLVVNFAGIQGLFRFLTGTQPVTWETATNVTYGERNV